MELESPTVTVDWKAKYEYEQNDHGQSSCKSYAATFAFSVSVFA